MKKTIIILSFLLSVLNAQAQYEPTLSDFSGNGISVDRKGYVCNFRGDQFSNCYNGGTSINDIYNQLGSTNYTYELDLKTNSFVLKFNGNQMGSEVMCNHFTADNCGYIERSAGGYVDLSDASNQFIELKVKSSVAVEQFGALIMTADRAGFFHLGDGKEHESESLPAGKWKVIKVPALFERWDGVTLDPSMVVGIAFYARSSNEKQPVGAIEIDYIRVGSSAKPFQTVGALSASGKGYAFSFAADEQHVCNRQVNTTNNQAFSFTTDYAADNGKLSQRLTYRRYELFAMEFVDQDCFLRDINLSEEKNRMIEIRIKPDEDITEFGLAISSNNLENKQWEYSKVEKYVPLKGGQWNTVSLPVSLTATSEGKLDAEHARGVVLVINPIERMKDGKEIPLKEGEVHYVIDYIHVGDAIGQ
jgi:hypothetical protein